MVKACADKDADEVIARSLKLGFLSGGRLHADVAALHEPGTPALASPPLPPSVLDAAPPVASVRLGRQPS